MSTQPQESGGFLRDRAKGGATAGVGLAGVAGGGMLRQRGLQRAHFEDTATPIKRTKLFAERQLARGARGRRTWGAGAALQLAAAPAVAVGGYRTVRGSNKDVTKADRNLLREGLIGARDAARERLSTQSEAPPSFSGSNIAATTGAGLATSGLAAAALRGKKAGPLLRSGALSTAGALGGAASIPAQAKVLELFVNIQEETGVAYLFITHDLAVVRSVSHRIAVLYKGRVNGIVPAGTPREVLGLMMAGVSAEEAIAQHQAEGEGQ